MIYDFLNLISGVVDMPWWGYVVVTLIFTHITIASITIYLHRHSAHRALELHPIPSHFFPLLVMVNNRNGDERMDGNSSQTSRKM